MKKLAPLFLCLMLALSLFAQQKYSRVKLFANEAELNRLANLGITVDHGYYKKGVFVIAAFSEDDLTVLDQNNFTYELMIDDLTAHYLKHQNDPYEKGLGDCEAVSNGPDYDTPSNFNLGTMGGFFKYNEFISHLDNMITLYPNLITAKQPISNFRTHENRPIYWLKISDNPNIDETEPEVLYTAMIHAREPQALSQLIFYMWYVLENYGTDTEITNIVDNTEMYFIPMINPDGYIQNETTNPNGGGMHRKNKRNVGITNPGVDLNRNFSYQWGVSGVSNSPNDDTYLGPNPFSEPESQAIKWFTEQHNFVLAFNYHTHGDLLLYPWGYTTSNQCTDDAYYAQFTTWMVSENGYSNYQSSGLYPAAGDTDDWMYGDTSTKQKILAMTPEVGDDFWISSSSIIPTAKETVLQNKMLAQLAGNFAKAKDISESTVSTTSANLSFEITRLGLVTPANFTVSLTAASGNIISTGSNKTFNNMGLGQTLTDNISYTLDPSIVDGDIFELVLIVDNGIYLQHDTITKTFGTSSVAFTDNCDNTGNWTTSGGSNSWETTTEDYYTSGSSITDSPEDNYSNNTTKIITLTNTFNLSNAIDARLKFWGKWEIETDWDYAQVEVSGDNGNTWVPMCGDYTNTGNQYQDENEPVYDGFQTSWIQEEISLNDFLGLSNVKVRFKMVSDQYVREDGFYFDEVTVETIGSSSGIGLGEITSVFISDFFPNPANETTSISFDNSKFNTSIFKLYSASGKLVKSQVINKTNGILTFSTNDLESGIYFGSMLIDGTSRGIKKLVILP